jgi:hypothetical protein
MQRVLIVSAALLIAMPRLQANGVFPQVPPKGFPPPGGPAMQAAKAKISIEIDEKATEPRLLVPIQVMFGGGGLGLGGGGAAFGVLGGPPANFGMAGGPPANFGMAGGPPANFGAFGNLGQQGTPPGLAGQKGALGQQGTPPPGAAGQQGGIPPTQPPPRPGGQDEEPSTEPESKRQSSLPFSTMMIGLALTLSFSTGGLWMARRKPGALGGAKPLGLLVAVLSIGLLGGAAVWANFAPPAKPPVPPAQPQVPGPLPALLKMEGVKVELLPQGDTIRLILTKKHKEQLTGKDATDKKEKPVEEEEKK